MDECTISNGGCEHQCTNLIGSYECSCIEGFVLKSDGRNCSGMSVVEMLLLYLTRKLPRFITCADVNECAISNGGCEHKCINKIGSYECSCNKGFILKTKRSCSGRG